MGITWYIATCEMKRDPSQISFVFAATFVAKWLASLSTSLDGFNQSEYLYSTFNIYRGLEKQRWLCGPRVRSVLAVSDKDCLLSV